MEQIISKNLKRYNQFVSGIDATYHEISYKLKISDSAMVILYTICNYGKKCALKTICYESGLSKQTINSSLRKLEKEEIIFLENSDLKRKMVCLTAKREELTQNTAIKLLKLENEIFDSWDEKDVNKYLEFTERFLNDLKKKVKDIN